MDVLNVICKLTYVVQIAELSWRTLVEFLPESTYKWFMVGIHYEVILACDENV